jgi:hypothetical protein
LSECDAIQKGRNCDEVRATCLLDNYTSGVKHQITVSDGSVQKNRVELKAKYQKGDIVVAVDGKAIESQTMISPLASPAVARGHPIVYPS